jgi:uncharacterized protein (TIGR02284 family)
MNEPPISSLENLIAVCKDGEAGFALAADEVSASALKSLFQGYSLQRSRLARDLGSAASALGRSSCPKDGEEGGTVRRTWMAPREGGIVRDEHAVLLECKRGEDAAAAAYAAVLEEPELPPTVRALITAQAVEVKSAHDELRDLLTRIVPAARV